MHSRISFWILEPLQGLKIMGAKKPWDSIAYKVNLDLKGLFHHLATFPPKFDFFCWQREALWNLQLIYFQKLLDLFFPLTLNCSLWSQGLNLFLYIWKKIILLRRVVKVEIGILKLEWCAGLSEIGPDWQLGGYQWDCTYNRWSAQVWLRSTKL